MTKASTYLILISAFLLMRCQSDSAESAEQKETVFFEEDVTFYAREEFEIPMKNGNDEFAGVMPSISDWEVLILDNDSIILLESSGLTVISEPTKNNRQIFGKLVESEEYLFEIQVSEYLFTSDCTLHPNSFNCEDTIPIFIDSLICNNSKKWKITSNYNQDTFLIDESQLFYKSNLEHQDSSSSIQFIPNEESGYYPITVEGIRYCSFSINQRKEKRKYYLDKSGNNYELIIDRTGYYGLTEKECKRCISKTKLNVK